MGISQLLIVVEVLREGRVLRGAEEGEHSVAAHWASRCWPQPEAGPAPPPGWLQLFKAVVDGAARRTCPRTPIKGKAARPHPGL